MARPLFPSQALPAAAATPSASEEVDCEALMQQAREEVGDEAEDEMFESSESSGDTGAGVHPDWTMSGWLSSLKLHVPLAQKLGAHVGAKGAGPGSVGSSKVQLAFVRKLGQAGSRQAVLRLLSSSGALQAMVDEVWRGAQDLSSARAATAAQLNDKFMQEGGVFNLGYGDLSTFFSGLQGLVGTPDVNLTPAMMREHCASADSLEEFSTTNYGITTTSRAEWYFVQNPQGGPGQADLEAWPKEDGHEEYCRQAKPLEEFAGEVERVNKLLEELREPSLMPEEVGGLRLYTGPMFQKYNATLRGFANPFMKGRWETLCKGNLYTTTLHVINSGIVKGGKVMKAQTVYRGIAGGLLPPEFWTPSKHNICGGVEFAFMSTTTNRQVSMQYASSGSVSTIFEINMGMVDRGADLSWVSQYPHEEEICFAPLTGLEVTSTRVENSVLVVAVRLNINLSALTIEQVLAKRKKVVLDMCQNLDLEVDQMLKSGSWGDLLAKMGPSRSVICKALKQPAANAFKAIDDRPAPAFNDDALLVGSIQSALAEKDAIQAPTMKILMAASKTLDSDDQPEAAKLLRTQAEAMAEFSKWTKEEVFERVVDLLKSPSDPDTRAVSKEVVALLHRCPQVTEVRFDWGHHEGAIEIDVQQGKALFTAMAACTTIKTLQVAGQRTENFGDRVADELAAMVEKNTTLAELDIPGIRLGAAGGIKLAKALEKNTTLRNLGLYANSELLSSQDGVMGHNVVAWASAIEKNTGLQKLGMWYTSCHGGCVSDEGGALIGKALGRNTMLETFHINGDRYTELSGEAFADAIEANVTLKELNLGHNECALTPESQKRIDRVVHSRGGKLKVGMKR